MTTTNRRLVVVPGFFGRERDLRAAFDAAVDPDVITKKHFSFNYWNIEGQYSYLRTPARSFFEPELFSAFEERLCSWGKETLGCNLVNSWWLSFYVGGCRQELHADVAHGPWAWVYSITNWDTRLFSGGETQVAYADTLDYWRKGTQFLRGERLGADRRRLFEEVPAHFGQLVIFDGRFPHGVREIRGTQDPRDSRVVMHGWFEPPSLQVDGALSKAAIVPTMRDRFALLGDALGDLPDADGTAIFRLAVDPSGSVKKVELLTDTLETTSNDPADRDRTRDRAREILAETRFPHASGVSRVIVPVTARRD